MISSTYYCSVLFIIINDTPKVEKLEDEDTIGPYLPKEKFIPLIDVLRHIDQLGVTTVNGNYCTAGIKK